MFKKILLVSIISVAFVSISFAGSGPNLKEGKWEITTSMEMPGMSMPPTTYTQCLTEKDFVPNQSNQANNECKIVKQTISGNTVSWTMECNGQGGKVTSSGKITYKGDSFSGTTVTTMDMGMKMTGKMSGKLVGKCQ